MHNKTFDCTNESGVREIRERRDPGVHSRLHRELSGGRGSDENHECAQVDDFQDVKPEVAVFMMGPNEESMEHAQARDSIPCGCERASRSRRWLSRMRAWEEEYDVCSSLLQSLSVAWSEFHKATWNGTSSTIKNVQKR